MPFLSSGYTLDPVIADNANMAAGTTGIGVESHFAIMAGSTIAALPQGHHIKIRFLLRCQRFHLKDIIVTAFAVQTGLIHMGIMAKNYADNRFGINNICRDVIIGDNHPNVEHQQGGQGGDHQ